MAAPVWVPGQVLASADVNSWFIGQYAYKTADTSRTTITLTADPDLTVAVVAGARYAVEAALFYKSTVNTNTFQWSWAVPAGSGGLYQGIYVGSGGGQVIDSHLWSDSGIQGGLPAASTIFSIAIRGTLVVSGTPGNLVFNWAQTTSSAPTITLTNHSQLRVTRIG